MSRRAAVFGASVFVLMNLVGRAQVTDLPATTETHGGFGLPDQRGTRLLVTSELARPEQLKEAICGRGLRVPIRFERRQAADARGEPNQTSRNFDKLRGSIFAVSGSPPDLDTPCLLASDGLLAGSEVLKISAPEDSGACLQQDRFATLRGRRVVHCWPLARVGPEQHLALLDFEIRGKDALASVVLVDGARAVFADLHAEFRGAGEDLWRVDDQGVLSPEGFKVVCVLQRGDWYALGTAWAAGEGESLALWVSEGPGRLTRVINDYWYQAPR
jgi:hypothetical protein